MFRLAFKNVMARKGRMILTSLAIIAGTMFLSGVLVISGTISASFDELFKQAYGNTDAFVRSSDVIEGTFDDFRDQIDTAVLTDVQADPRVVGAEPFIQNFASMTGSDGKPLQKNDGPPEFGGVITDSPTSPWDLDDGRLPTGSGEVVIDKRSARSGKVALGDTIKVRALAGSRETKVVGIAKFGGADTSGGASWALFDPATASEFVLNEPTKADGLLVKGDGSVSDEQLAADLEKTLKAKYGEVEVLTGAEITKEEQSAIQRGLSFVTLFLTVFALISLFVAAFVIYNVFTITQTQRARENALMRAIGASRQQVTRNLLIEALIVGIAASVAGFFAGIGLAALLVWILKSAGFDLSRTLLTVPPTTPAIVIGTGVLVTIACATVPALRAGRVPPLAAMRDVAIEQTAMRRSRVLTGAGFAAAAVLCLVMGLRTGGAWYLGLGVVAFYTTIIVFGPVIAEPIARLLGRPLRSGRGVTGAMSAENSVRNPRRTAVTAAALIIGLSLMIAISAVGSSIRASVRKLATENFKGDLIVTTTNDGGGLGTLPGSLSEQLRAADGVSFAEGLGGAQALVEDRKTGKFGKGDVYPAVTKELGQQLLDIQVVDGSLDEFDAGTILVSKTKADKDGLRVGDTLKVKVVGKEPTDLRIAAIFDAAFAGRVVLNREFVGADKVLDWQVQVKLKPGVSQAEGKKRLQPIVDALGGANLLSRDEFLDQQLGELDGFLNFIYVLLLMAVIIAAIGIVVTLLLSIYERRRELGLLRSVGMTRPQMRSMVRWESVIFAILGAVQGVVVGIALAWVVVRALKSRGLEEFSVSPTAVIAFVSLAVLLGLAAALFPARRAARANILEAIATG